MSGAPSPRLTVDERITRLVPYSPGKPIEEVKRELGLSDVVKLASNENALGPSPLAADAIREAAGRAHLYPEGSCHDLRHAVSEHLGIPGDHLIFGNGSDEIIHYLGLTYLTPGDEVIQADPSFVRYESAAILNGAPCHKVPLTADWEYDLGAMADRLSEHTRLIFIANPNNPTGTIVADGPLRHFLNCVPDRAIVVMDEAYLEFVERPEFPDSLALIREGRNVAALRTFSKTYGLAGIRLGYGIARPEIIAHLEQVREPFNVSLLAQAAGIAALRDTEFLQRTRAMNRAGKRQLYAAFEDLGLPFTPTEGNFVWVDVRRSCLEVFQALLRRGIIVRTGDIFGAPTHLRVTIGTESQNARFLAALKEALEE